MVRTILSLWREKWDTAAIARHLRVSEAVVRRVVSDDQDLRYWQRRAQADADRAWGAP